MAQRLARKDRPASATEDQDSDASPTATPEAEQASDHGA
jgi:hypothetical protein